MTGRRPTHIPSDRWDALTDAQRALLMFTLRHPTPNTTRPVEMTR